MYFHQPRNTLYKNVSFQVAVVSLVPYLALSTLGQTNSSDADELFEPEVESAHERNVNLNASFTFKDQLVKERLVHRASSTWTVVTPTDNDQTRLTGFASETYTLIPRENLVAKYRLTPMISLIPKSNIKKGKFTDLISLNATPSCNPLNHVGPNVYIGGQIRTYFSTTCTDLDGGSHNWVVRVWLKNHSNGENVSGADDLLRRKSGTTVTFHSYDTQVLKPCQDGNWRSRVRLVLERFPFSRVVYDNTFQTSILCPIE